ncbi:MAG: hypothetical protein LBG97_07885 [Coriobacteriales bacterium]|jgi:hypothetical protein|nr:hypothetical protein [Coriobacteriales bacterium]
MIKFRREDIEADPAILHKMKMFVRDNLEGEFKLTRDDYNRIADEYEYEWHPSRNQELLRRRQQQADVEIVEELQANVIVFDPNNLTPTFMARLIHYIDNCEIEDIKQDSDLYRRAGISRQLFARYRAGDAPGKDKVIAIALALQLNLAETKDLLESVGFSLSNAYLFDVIIRCAIIAGEYDVYAINTVLRKNNQPELPYPDIPLNEYKQSLPAARR